MPKLIMMKGLPASGKTTWAKEFVEQYDKNAVKRVNKDDLRAMLDNGRWSKGNEEFVLMVRDFIVSRALDGGKHVVVDDTNLAPKHEEKLREIAEALGGTFQVQYMEVPLKECILRDSKRDNPVGEEAIVSMYNKFLRPDMEEAAHKAKYDYHYSPHLPPAIICDLDGTLAIKSDRTWHQYDRVGEDRVNLPIIIIIDNYLNSEMVEYKPNVIFVSGRPDSCREETQTWLENNGFHGYELYMRKAGDNRKDSIVKKEIYEEHIKPYWNIEFVLDDRNQVVDMWRKECNLPCLQVNYGDF